MQLRPEAGLEAWQRNEGNRAQISSPWPGRAPGKQDQSPRLRAKKQLSVEECGAFTPHFVPQPEAPCLLLPAGSYTMNRPMIFRCIWAPEHMPGCSLLCFPRSLPGSPEVSWFIFQPSPLCRTTAHMSRVLINTQNPDSPLFPLPRMSVGLPRIG